MISYWAPVVIPTLNRFKHFKECLESLERCYGAECTDVFVALDFPPSEKYQKGWLEIDNYLIKKEKDNKFKSLNVFRRNRNFGIHKIGGNTNVLVSDVLKIYDRYILSEDDNIFSPCFLEFVNKGLERYKEDPRVYAICGYDFGKEDKPLPSDTNYYLTKRTNAWGIGRWRDKLLFFKENYCNMEQLRECMMDKQKRKEIQRKSPRAYYKILSALKRNRIMGDGMTQVMLELEDMYNVFPKESMVRNVGLDGTGDHKGTKAQVEWYTNQYICKNERFEYEGDEIILSIDDADAKKHITWKSKIEFFISRIDSFLFCNFGFLPKSRYI